MSKWVWRVEETAGEREGSGGQQAGGLGRRAAPARSRESGSGSDTNHGEGAFLDTGEAGVCKPQGAAHGLWSAAGKAQASLSSAGVWASRAPLATGAPDGSALDIFVPGAHGKECEGFRFSGSPSWSP